MSPRRSGGRHRPEYGIIRPENRGFVILAWIAAALIGIVLLLLVVLYVGSEWIIRRGHDVPLAQTAIPDRRMDPDPEAARRRCARHERDLDMMRGVAQRGFRDLTSAQITTIQAYLTAEASGALPH